MKKSIIILFLAVVSFSLMAFAYVNIIDVRTKKAERACVKSFALNDNLLNPFDKTEKAKLDYNLGSRFLNTISKTDLQKAKTVVDIIPVPGCGGRSILSIQNVMIAILLDEGEIIELGENEMLNAAQLKLLQSVDYSTNFYISADTQIKIHETGQIEDSEIVYYMTVIPEKEAEYAMGKIALIEYLEEKSKEESAVISQSQLRPGIIQFRVSEAGKIVNVNFESTCGYTSIDQKMLEIISNLPGSWIPAQNSEGENIDQDFVFFFGKMGC